MIPDDVITSALSRMAWKQDGTLQTVPGSVMWRGVVDLDDPAKFAVANIATWPIPNSSETGAMGTIIKGTTLQKLLPQQAQYGLAKALATTPTPPTATTAPTHSDDDFDLDAVEEG